MKKKLVGIVAAVGMILGLAVQPALAHHPSPSSWHYRSNKLAALIAGAVLMIGLTAPVSAHYPTPPYSHYQGGCDDVGAEDSYYIWSFHSVDGPDRYDASQARLTFSNSTSSAAPNEHEGFSMLNGANLQGDSGSQMVQVGIITVACAYIAGCPSDDGGGPGWVGGISTTFWFTAHDNVGDSATAAYWVDFDNDGGMDYPQVGHTYEFYIGAYGNPDRWRLQVTDLTTGAYDYHYIGRTFASGAHVMWGAELVNTAGVLGRTGGAAGINLTAMRFSTTTSGGWSNYIQYWGPNDCQWVRKPAFYGCAASSSLQGLGLVINPYTYYHSSP